MRVPDEVLKCVCFLCTRTTDNSINTFRYSGTGFFVTVKSAKHENAQFVYFVTARHNIQKASGPLYLRINTLSGDSEHLEIKAPWIYPEKNGVDLAMLGWAPDRSLYDYRTIPSDILFSKEVLETESIGVGDELFCVGLFTYRHGAKQNYPIVRSGIIASMPNEPFEDPKTAFKYDAYLAEVRSIGGLSGSPVFVGLPDVINPTGMKRARKKLFYLLGVIRGHWDLKRRETSLDFADEELREVNMGMAIVTPIEELSTMLGSPQIKMMREKTDSFFEQQENAPLGPTKD
jgi:hypothetical protein